MQDPVFIKIIYLILYDVSNWGSKKLHSLQANPTLPHLTFMWHFAEWVDRPEQS